jgi:apolipoprotein N-acyltransferase
MLWRTPLLVFLVFFSASVLYGEIAFLVERNREPEKQVRIALIQQNTDPRKDDYRDSFNVLRFLTDKAMAEQPDLVAWSETAFVPNIRKWSKLDPEKYGYARLVHDFLAYQKSLGTWLITGNDDYMTVTTELGEERVDYNASILFSPEGERMETYHKLHLVPFTEYFPYREQFPGFYNLLLDFDVNLWEPGTEPIVFEHPKFTFSTPICFEDSFPGDIRRFVRNGAEVILNLSNDFWSLTTVEAKQHFVNSLFRAVETRRPLARSTASGLTAYVDTAGRVRSSLPYYVEGYVVVDVEIPESRTTLYTLAGDWFPIALIALLILLPIGYYFLRDQRHINGKAPDR